MQASWNALYQSIYFIAAERLLATLIPIPERVLMRRHILQLAATCSLAFTLNIFAATHYVDLNCLNPVSPYTNWATAATNIQDAVDAAVAGDDVLVTNGVYESGGRVVNGIITNRVAVTQPILLHSVNGPASTIIKGYQVPDTIYGDNAVRCVYLTNGASLAGFTLTNGATQARWEEVPLEDTLGGGVWCESTTEVVSNCIIANNWAGYCGGGVYLGTLYDCRLTWNWAHYGGGAHSGILNRCNISSNSSAYFNSGSGGGVQNCRLNYCILSQNMSDWGGGAYESDLNGCALVGNTAAAQGGGAFNCILNNCTVILNGSQSGGGVFGGAITNNVVFYNTASNNSNYYNTSIDHSCTTPLPASGTGNFADAPLLADTWHLTSGSPCRGAGSAATATGTDLDGEPWLDPPSVGADEFFSGSITGALRVVITASYTNVMTNFMVNLTGLIDGHASESRWDFGDGTIVSNQPLVLHSWQTAGTYTVTLTACNESFPSGTSGSFTLYVDDVPRYVAQGNPDPVWPFNSWAAAATNIQDAVDAAPIGGLVLVSNGIYEVGGRVVGSSTTNRVAIMNPLTLRSVNGPAVTTIKGYRLPAVTNGADAIRCIYLAEGTSLAGFTLTNGATMTSSWDGRIVYGGGAYCAGPGVSISNCMFARNSAAERGGGAANGNLFNCQFIGNIAFLGGGASGAVLTGCVLMLNQAHEGGGAIDCTLSSCIVASNKVTGFGCRGGGVYSSRLGDCLLVTNSATYPSGGDPRYRGQGGGAYNSSLTNCVLIGNIAGGQGGGAIYGTLDGCRITACSAQQGGGTVGGTLLSCVLSNNSSSYSGGGACYGTLNDCLLTGNSSDLGGGACYGTLDNCIITGNSAQDGAGLDECTAVNCIIYGNSAVRGGGSRYGTNCNCTIISNSASSYGGGFYSSTASNCIVYYNASSLGPNYYSGSLGYCCTTPLAPGAGNISNPPLFVSPGNGNFQLQSNSPCINAGNNTIVSVTNDLDGNPRISGGTVDIGAYEFQNPASVISYAWLQQYGLTNNGSADYADPDGDGLNNWNEWLADTSPLNANDYLHITSFTRDGTYNLLQWTSKSTRLYRVERSAALDGTSPWETIITNAAPGWDNVGFDNTGPQYFYRIQAVQP
jgi:hypothetical protein